MNPRKSTLRATYETVAEKAQVSKTTVSLVMRGLARDRIPAETYARVEAACREVGYYPNGLVQSIRRGKTQMIGVVAPSVGLEHVARILEGIRQEASRHGLSVLLGSCSSDPEEERLNAEKLLHLRVDGLIRFSAFPDSTVPPPWLTEAVKSGIPCVLVDDLTLAGKADCVVSDDTEGAYLAVRHLIEAGHTKIAHFDGDDDRTSARERAEGYRRALREADLPYECLVGHTYSGDGLEAEMHGLFASEDRPSAIFCCTDSIAVQVQSWLRNSNRRVPTDVAVIGFAGTSIAREAHLTTVAQPFEEMGTCAVRRLVERIHGDTRPFDVDRLPTELILRRSSAVGNPLGPDDC